jgi:uncharacterized membrane protein YeiH
MELAPAGETRQLHRTLTVYPHGCEAVTGRCGPLLRAVTYDCRRQPPALTRALVAAAAAAGATAHKVCADSNANAQLKGLETLLVFLQRTADEAYAAKYAHASRHCP